MFVKSPCGSSPMCGGGEHGGVILSGVQSPGIFPALTCAV